MSSFVALLEKGATFSIRRVDLERKEHFEEEYVRLSKTGKVPTLVDGDFALSESSAIIEYLDETIDGNPLLPHEPKLRARARQIQSWLRSDFLFIRSERPTDVIFRAPSAKPLSVDAQAQARKLFDAALEWLGNAEYVCGSWCAADIDLTIMLSRLVSNGDPVPTALERYVERQWARPSLQQWRDLPRT